MPFLLLNTKYKNRSPTFPKIQRINYNCECCHGNKFQKNKNKTHREMSKCELNIFIAPSTLIDSLELKADNIATEWHSHSYKIQDETTIK